MLDAPLNVQINLTLIAGVRNSVGRELIFLEKLDSVIKKKVVTRRKNVVKIPEIELDPWLRPPFSISFKTGKIVSKIIGIE